MDITAYFNERCREMGLTPEINSLSVPEYLNPDAPGKVYEAKILDVDEKGNILIPLYDLNNQPRRYYKDNPGKLQNGKTKDLVITRFHPDNIQEKGPKYHTPKGAITYPWISPNISEAFRKKEKINTIVITEGYIKSICGWINGLHIFGLSGIQNYKSKETQTLHPEILDVIRTCGVVNIVLLYDGDCTDISSGSLEEGKDLYTRPNGFFSSARNIKELLKDSIKDHEVDVYFAHVNSRNFETVPKGLDDLYLAHPEEKKAITTELTSFSKQAPHFFWKTQITFNLKKLQNHLHIDTVQNFYLAHAERIKDKEFIFNGSKYKHNEQKNEVEIVIPAAAKYFFRVGDTYHEKIKVPNKYNQLEFKYVRRLKQTIVDDHGKSFVNHIPKYKEFCNVPDHENYQEIIHNCYNRYHPFEWSPGEDKDCEATLDFVRHIFGDQYERGLDYIQLLYQKPTQILPILCLVSKENGTGKSTFAKWLKMIFTNNMAIVGNSELENEFNGSYADKLIICCDEAFIDKKKVIEKIKSLSTADRITLNQKGKDHVEIDFFGKFLLLTNNEENFISATEDDIRYWVRKIPVVKKETNILPILQEEIPAFLRFLQERTLVTENTGSRMWFTKEQIFTEALKNVVLFNKPTLEKEIRARLRDLFLDSGVSEIKMSISDVHKEFFNGKYEHQYIERLLKENLKVTNNGKPERYSYPKKMEIFKDGLPVQEMILVKRQGRPFVFLAENFLSKEEHEGLQLCEDLESIMPRSTAVPAGSQSQELFNNQKEEDDLPF